MSWCPLKCPHLNRQGACRLAGAVATDIPVPVVPSDCEACKGQPEPSLATPNGTVSRLAAGWKVQRRVKLAPPTPSVVKESLTTPPAYTADDFPCEHRGAATGEHQCTPCDGGILHVLYDCGLHGGQCTVLAAPKARGKDGERVRCCLACIEAGQNGPITGHETDMGIGMRPCAAVSG